jgi:hypothetical protein
MIRFFILWLALAGAAIAATGDIVSATIRPDGWSADIVIEGLGTGGTYDMGLGTNNNPATGTPKITFTVVSKALRADGATTLTRTIYGTKQVRKPYPDQATNDETAEGGNVRVRVALSEMVFSTDKVGGGNSGTDPVVNILSGFYTQGTSNNASGASFPVTNNSESVHQTPVANWSMEPWGRVTGPFKLRVCAFHVGARLGRPVHSVQFSVTDGTNTETALVTAATIDTEAGDAVPVIEYIGEFDADDFIQGAVLTCNYTAYGWYGDVVATSVGGPSHPTPVPTPLPLLCDKTGGYGITFAVVDPVDGTDPGSVSDDTGKWVGNGSAPGDGSGVTAFATIARAARAIRNYNSTNRSRDDTGGGIIFCRAGTYAWMGATISGGYGSTPATWTTVMPFPGVSRASVIIASASGNTDISDRVKLLGVTLTSETSNTFGGVLATSVENCDLANAAGTAVFNTANSCAWFIRNRVTAWRQGFRPFSSATNWTVPLLRGNEFAGFSRAILPYVMVGNKNLQKQQWDSVVIKGRLSTSSQPLAPIIVAFNDLRGWKATSSSAIIEIGDLDMSLTSVAIVQNLFESTTNASGGIGNVGASSFAPSDPLDNFLIWHNTCVGQRMQFAYNSSGGVAKSRKFWSVKGNYWDIKGYKTDTHTDPGADGNHIGNWPVGFGVDHSGNVNRVGTFRHEFFGFRSIEWPQTPYVEPSWPQFIDRKSFADVGETDGMGNYRLDSESPMRGLMTDWVLPYDLDGNPRGPDDSPGVYSTYEGGEEPPPDPDPDPQGTINATNTNATTVTIGQ